MERVLIKSNFLITSVIKKLLKQCFRNPLYALVPFEIWLTDIVLNAELKVIFKLAQACFAFKELVDTQIKTNFRFALMCRQQLQMPMAKRCLELCANNGDDPDAFLHLGHAIESNGWSINPKQYHFKNTNFKYNLLYNCTSFMHDLRGNVMMGVGGISRDIKQKLLEFDDPLISGYVYMCEQNFEMAKDLFLNKVPDNNKEFALLLLAKCVEELDQKITCYRKAAHLGNVAAIRHLWYFYYKSHDNDPKHKKKREKYRKLLELQDYKCIKIKTKHEKLKLANNRNTIAIAALCLLCLCIYIIL